MDFGDRSISSRALDYRRILRLTVDQVFRKSSETSVCNSYFEWIESRGRLHDIVNLCTVESIHEFCMIFIRKILRIQLCGYDFGVVFPDPWRGSLTGLKGPELSKFNNFALILVKGSIVFKSFKFGVLLILYNNWFSAIITFISFK